MKIQFFIKILKKVELTGRQTGYKLLKSALKESNARMHSVKVI